MTNFIPIFPLNIVVYPGEDLNLHIFEDRYIQMITDCFAEGKPFGIPAVLKNNLSEMGTLMQITEVVAVHSNGSMDIRTRGESVFRILEVIKTLPDKLYCGAIVHYPDNLDHSNKEKMRRIIHALRKLHRLLKVDKDFKKPDEELVSYDVAHHMGLTIEEEYELLNLMQESQRQEYLKRHLNKVLPVVTGIEKLKAKIRLNGHFKELKGFDW